MSLHDQTEKAKNDWNKLAQDALDLWQNHLTSLANDPEAKEELAQLVSPMGKMFSDWTEMVQQSVGGFMQQTAADVSQSSQSEASTERDPVASETGMADVPVAPRATPEFTTQVQPVMSEAKMDTPYEPVSTAATKEPAFQSSPVASRESEGKSGSAVSTSGHRNMVELADRLAFLERELEELQAKREGERGGDALGEARQSVQPMVATDKR